MAEQIGNYKDSFVKVLCSSSTINKVYRLNDSSKSLQGSYIISITHPYYSSVIAVTLSRLDSNLALNNNIIGTYRGPLKIYKKGGNIYFKVNSIGADVLTVRPFSFENPILEEVPVTIDSSFVEI